MFKYAIIVSQTSHYTWLAGELVWGLTFHSFWLR